MGGYSIKTTLASGLVTTASFDTAGKLLSEANSSGATALGTVTDRYDAAGQLRQVSDANGITEHHF